MIRLRVIEPRVIRLGICEKITIIDPEKAEHYTGDYVVDPTFETQTLETQNKLMDNDVVVNPIEVSRTTNPSGGTTVYIGGIQNG